jgi:hypothetical protein
MRGFRTVTEKGVAAYNGYVRTARQVREDPSMSLERFLLDRLPEELDAHRERIRAQWTDNDGDCVAEWCLTPVALRYAVITRRVRSATHVSSPCGVVVRLLRLGEAAGQLACGHR